MASHRHTADIALNKWLLTAYLTNGKFVLIPVAITQRVILWIQYVGGRKFVKSVNSSNDLM